MELDNFVTTVLTNIVSGIRKAQEADETGAFVVPGGIGGHEYAKHPRVSISGLLSSTVVDFDIAITVEESKSKSGSGGLKVAGIGASGEGSSAAKDSRVSRIQFGVPVLLPESQKPWHEVLKEGN